MTWLLEGLDWFIGGTEVGYSGRADRACRVTGASWPNKVNGRLDDKGDPAWEPCKQPYGPGIRGYLPSGLAVAVSNGLPVADGKHSVLVVPSSECFLWEQPSVMIRAEQPMAAQLGVMLVCYSYVGFEYRRYANALQSVSGIDLSPAQGG